MFKISLPSDSVRRRRPGGQSAAPPHILIDGRQSIESDEVRCFEKQRQEHKLGIMLIAVSVMFIVCQSFKMIPDLYEILFCSDKSVPCTTTPFIKTCLNLSHLLVSKSIKKCGICKVEYHIRLLLIICNKLSVF
jgi:hypothetical protein